MSVVIGDYGDCGDSLRVPPPPGVAPDVLLRRRGRPLPLSAGRSRVGFQVWTQPGERDPEHRSPVHSGPFLWPVILPSQSDIPGDHPIVESPRYPAPCILGAPRWFWEEEVLRAHRFFWQRERQAWGVRLRMMDGYNTVQGVGDGRWPYLSASRWYRDWYSGDSASGRAGTDPGWRARPYLQDDTWGWKTSGHLHRSCVSTLPAEVEHELSTKLSRSLGTVVESWERRQTLLSRGNRGGW